ncbi:hypothetical protein E0493_22745 [Roseomonas sp. M0104]|uniref:Exonuclease domain-containing protein n=1 Tax=Teichococcus coralli TaxID=2545983 RepID=A0A845BJB0_9PROT|nr:hypothetical protein [Pseudoroseomonas coralli]MXP66150.1 hypothetical protein [Pseudoroseomonas coralli]
MTSSTAAEADPDTLEASGRYRVLRRIAPRPAHACPPGVSARLGLLLDLEITGLDPAQDEIIAFAMLPFTYGLDSTLAAAGEPHSRLRQPSHSIPPALTGLIDVPIAVKHVATVELAYFLGPISRLPRRGFHH